MANSWIVKHLQVNPINGNPTRVSMTDITLFQFDYFCYEPIFHLAAVSIIVNVYAIFEGIANYSLKNFNFFIETYRSIIEI